MVQRIMITVIGWPDKKELHKTRIVMVQDCKMAKLTTTSIVNRLGGLYQIEMRVMDKDEPTPDRSDVEYNRGQDILMNVLQKTQ